MKEYWLCLVGPLDRENLIAGADFIMRLGIYDKIVRVTAKCVDTDNVEISSGWGVTEEQAEKIRKILSE